MRTIRAGSASTNTDLRYANNIVLEHEQSLIYGVSLNTQSDRSGLWNSTPAWGFPYASSNASLSPLAGTQIDGADGTERRRGSPPYVMWK